MRGAKHGWLLCLAALAASGCQEERRRCGEYDEAEALYAKLTAEILDPEHGDPRFARAAQAFEAVPEGCERRETGLAIARTIREGMAKRQEDDDASSARRAAAEAASRAAAAAAAARRAAEAAEAKRRTLSPLPAPLEAAPDAQEAEPPEPKPTRPRRPRKRKDDRKAERPRPDAPRALTYCAFLSHAGAVHQSGCYPKPRAEAQALCDQMLEKRGIPGQCNCSDDPEYINGRCK